jgi:hypothetical protein
VIVKCCRCIRSSACLGSGVWGGRLVNPRNNLGSKPNLKATAPIAIPAIAPADKVLPPLDVSSLLSPLSPATVLPLELFAVPVVAVVNVDDVPADVVLHDDHVLDVVSSSYIVCNSERR